MESYEDMRRRYQARGIGARTGFGARPCLLVIDMTVAFNDPQYAVGADMAQAVAAIAELLAAARAHDVLVVYVITAYADVRDGGLFVQKIPAAAELMEGSPAVAVDPRIAPRHGEPVITKKAPSAFFRTDLAALLERHRVDTVILSGCSTSGCIRAAAIDAVSHGLRTVVPLEAVGDRAVEPHLASLFDIDAKYGDVMPLADVLDYLRGLTPSCGP